MLAQLRDIPALAAEETALHLGSEDRIALAGDGLDERGLAAAVGTENGDVLSGCDGEIDIVEDDRVAARYADLLHAQKFGRMFEGQSLSFLNWYLV